MTILLPTTSSSTSHSHPLLCPPLCSSSSSSLPLCYKGYRTRQDMWYWFSLLQLGVASLQQPGLNISKHVCYSEAVTKHTKRQFKPHLETMATCTRSFFETHNTFLAFGSLSLLALKYKIRTSPQSLHIWTRSCWKTSQVLY